MPFAASSSPSRPTTSRRSRSRGSSASSRRVSSGTTRTGASSCSSSSRDGLLVSRSVRKLVLIALPVTALALLAAGLAQGSSTASCASPTVSKGSLTVGTDNPAYPPWFGGKEGHGWKVSDPYSGKGYESAVTYAVAKQLGYSKASVKWAYVPFLKSFSPGKKSFDFDINQASYSADRAKTVTFSSSYYD